MTIYLASGNKHKQKELTAILGEHSVKLPEDAGINSFDPAETGNTFAENALIKAWALYKLLSSSSVSLNNNPVLADDSGLCVDILGGKPGIYSARYYGKDSWNNDGSFRENPARAKLTDNKRNQLLLDEIIINHGGTRRKERDSIQNSMELRVLCGNNNNFEYNKNIPVFTRKCRFVCAMVLFFGPERFYLVQETMEGEIVSSAAEIRGAGGFGYDPIVYLPEFGCTVAELPEEEKNRHSHRGKAGRAIAKLITSD